MAGAFHRGCRESNGVMGSSKLIE
jgi:hypothetical protein